MSTLLPPPKLDPRLVCRGALTPWSKLKAAVADLDFDIQDLNGFTPIGHVPVGGREATIKEIASNPSLLVSAKLPATLYSQVLWGGTKSSSAAAEISMVLQTLETMANSSSASALPVHGIIEALNGPQGLSKVAEKASQDVNEVLTTIKKDEGLHDNASQTAADAIGAATNPQAPDSRNGEAFQSHKAFDRMAMLNGVRRDLTDKAYQLDNAKSLAVTASILANLQAAVTTLKECWDDAAESFRSCAQTIEADQGISPADALKMFDSTTARQHWKRFADEARLFVQSNL